MEELGAEGIDITKLSIDEMAEHLTSKSPCPDQLTDFMHYVDASEDPQTIAKQLFIAYAVAQSNLPSGFAPDDLLATAQSYLRGHREGQPLEERQRGLFLNNLEFQEAIVALQGLRIKCM